MKLLLIFMSFAGMNFMHLFCNPAADAAPAKHNTQIVSDILPASLLISIN